MTNEHNEQCDPDVDHPRHYGGADNPYEAIKIIEAHSLNFNLGNTLKYILRAGKKDLNDCLTMHDLRHATIKDLKKAVWYLNREIANIEKAGTKDAKQSG